jgi:endonuclease/exonuclease/phosphatase (EEP) superfamily protein YafD
MAVLRRVLRRARRAAPVAAGALAAAVLLPDVLRLDRRLPAIATVAWRPQGVVCAAAGAAVLAVWRPARPTAAALGAVAVAGAAAVAARLRRPRARRRPPAAADPVTLTVLTLNVFGGRADTGEVAALLGREAPDLVVLPEAGCDYRDKLAPLVADLGYRGWAATPPGVSDGRGVVVLAGPRAGDVRVRSGSELHYRHLRVGGGVLGDRDLLAVHVTAPRNRRLAGRWRRELAHVGRWTRVDPPPIVAGDLNATLDNGPLRDALGGCVPAAVGRGGLVGTFPSSLPRWCGIQIDHVLVPAGTETVHLAVHDVAGTDHRGVVARLRLPAAGGSPPER